MNKINKFASNMLSATSGIIRSFRKPAALVPEKNNIANAKKDNETLRFVPDQLIAYIQPFQQEMDLQGVTGVVGTLIKLIEDYGNSSLSIVTDKNCIYDDEIYDLEYPYKKILSQITLMMHTYKVVENMATIVKKEYSDYKKLMPMTIIASLAHDLGKIQEFRGNNPCKMSQHSLISGMRLAELLFKVDVSWKDTVIEAVKRHHIDSEDQFDKVLKQADKKAREAELMLVMDGYTRKKFDEWFNADRFIEKLKPEINVRLHYNRKLKAFSYKGIIFVRPMFMYEIARNMCDEAKTLDMNFVYDSDKEVIMKQISEALKNAGHVLDTLKEGRYSVKYEIIFTSGKRFTEYLLPLKIKGISDIDEINGSPKKIILIRAK